MQGLSLDLRSNVLHVGAQPVESTPKRADESPEITGPLDGTGLNGERPGRFAEVGELLVDALELLVCVGGHR